MHGSPSAFEPTQDLGLTKDTKLFGQIKGISNAENTGSIIASNYHSRWTNNGEIKAVLDVLKTAINSIPGDSVNLNSFDVSNISPEVIKNMLAAINKADIISDAVPHFVKDAFTSMHVNELTKLNGVDYASYYLGRKIYGGNDGLAGEGTDIYYIYRALSNLYNGANPNKYANLTAIKDIVSSLGNLDGLFDFISNSHILNTNISTKEYNSLNDLGGSIKVSARGIIMLNLFGGNSDAIFTRYLTGSNNDQKATTLSKIFTLSNYSYVAESRGLIGIVSKANDLGEDTSFSAENYSSIKAKVNILEGLMETCYDAIDGKRSYFASEVIGNILDEAINTERTRITSVLGLTYGNTSFTYAPSSYLNVSETSYDNINEIEKLGLDGIFSFVDVVTRIASGDLSGVTKANLCSAFDKMGNSEIAKLYYLSRAHKRASSTDSFVLDFTQQPAVALLYGSTWGSYTSEIYEPSFSFSSYGESLATWLGIA